MMRSIGFVVRSMATSKPIRFAILGCGRIARRHAECLQQVDGAALVAAADVNASAALSFAQQHGLQSFSSIESLIEWGEFDAVCVCTPSGLHAEHSLALSSAGKHVVVEKPMALRLDDADRMIAAAAAAGRGLFVVRSEEHT